MTPTRTTLIVAAAFAAAGIASAPASAADPITCKASAISASILGGPAVEPVVANGTGAGCQNADAKLDQLPGPLSAGTATAQTITSSKAAGSSAGVADFAIGGLNAMPITLPTPQIPAGLDAIAVPLSSQLQLLGLPSTINVSALDAAQALVPTRALPNLDILRVDAVSAAAGVLCQSGIPQLLGGTVVQGVHALGEQLSATEPVAKAITLLDGLTIPLTNLDSSDVTLPAGLSFDAPVVGPLLRQAVDAALTGLPPITVPATVANVQTSTNEKETGSNSLTHRALRVKVSVLGTELADVTLGLAAVGGLLDCSEPKVEPASPTELALECSTRKLTLVDVVRKGRRVQLTGAADKSLVGQTVDLVLTATNRTVAQAVVAPDGSFEATAPLPPKAIRDTNEARYLAVSGQEKSLRLKLARRMQITQLQSVGGLVRMAGTVDGPLAKGSAVTIKRRVSCTKEVVVKRVKPGRDGRWSTVLPAPPEAQAAVYRAETEVMVGEHDPKPFATYTLPGYVAL